MQLLIGSHRQPSLDTPLSLMVSVLSRVGVLTSIERSNTYAIIDAGVV
ncbi:hypothetical protein QTO30_08675 [Yoonia sp. GPGPB17]